MWRVAQLHRAEEKELIKQLHEKQRRIISGFSGENVPTTAEPTIFGETLETMDYSPEIDKYLKIICFPTFAGHCGCILFDINEIKFTKNSNDAEKTLLYYFGMPMTTDN